MVELNLPGKPTNRRWMSVLTDDAKFAELMSIKPETKVRNLNRTLEAFGGLKDFDDLVDQNSAVKNKIAGNQALAEEMEKRFIQITKGLKAILETKLESAKRVGGLARGSQQTDNKAGKKKLLGDKIKEIMAAHKSNAELTNDAKKLILQFSEIAGDKNTYMKEYSSDLDREFGSEMVDVMSSWGSDVITGKSLKDHLLGKTFGFVSMLQVQDNFIVPDITLEKAKVYLKKYASQYRGITMPTGNIKQRTTGNKVGLDALLFRGAKGDRLDKLIMPLLEESQTSNLRASLSGFVNKAMGLSVLSTEDILISFSNDVLNKFKEGQLKNNKVRYMGKPINPSDNADSYYLGERFSQSNLNKNPNVRKAFTSMVRTKVKESDKLWGELQELYLQKRGDDIGKIKDDFQAIGDEIIDAFKNGDESAEDLLLEYEDFTDAVSRDKLLSDSGARKQFAMRMRQSADEHGLQQEYEKFEQKSKRKSGVLIASSLYQSSKETSIARNEYPFLKKLPSNDHFDEILYLTITQIYKDGEPDKMDYFSQRPKGEVYKDVFSIFQFIDTVHWFVTKESSTKGDELIKKIKGVIKSAIATEKHNNELLRHTYLSELEDAKDFLTIGEDINKLGDYFAEALQDCRTQIPLIVKNHLQTLVDSRAKAEKIMGDTKLTDKQKESGGLPQRKAVELFTNLTIDGLLSRR